MLCRLNADEGWVRVTISRVSASQHGIPRDVFRNVVIGLEECAFIERLVGYPGALKLTGREARRGRLVWLRAAPRLIDLCERHGINGSNLFTHFPSLSG